MKIIEDEKKFRPLAEKAIEKFGCVPEHNLGWFFCATEPYQQPIFALWPDGSGLLTQKENKAWYVFSEPLASADKTLERLTEFVKYALEQPNITKVCLDLASEERQRILKILPEHNLKSLAINNTDIWPVMNMEQFDPDLPGQHFKEIRNARNKFYREHQVEIIKAAECPTAELKKLIEAWKKTRKAPDRAYCYRYQCLVETRFQCCQTARAMIVDGRPAGLNGGWEIPNSHGGFYAAIGLHDYSLRDLGLMLYFEDLTWIKNAGYKTADLGGGGQALTDFKNQFLPESEYKTFEFSVAKKLLN